MSQLFCEATHGAGDSGVAIYEVVGSNLAYSILASVTKFIVQYFGVYNNETSPDYKKW